MALIVHATPTRKFWFNKAKVIEKDDLSFKANTSTTNLMHSKDNDSEVMWETIAPQSIPIA